MAIEKTLSIIKPDATARNITGEINSRLESAGLRIIAQRRILMSRELAEGFYAEHTDRPFFDSLCTFMTSGPVIVQVLEGDEAINLYRKIMGSTNPDEASIGTLRKDYAESIERNSVHGSDSSQSAVREIDYFFTEEQIVG